MWLEAKQVLHVSFLQLFSVLEEKEKLENEKEGFSDRVSVLNTYTKL